MSATNNRRPIKWETEYRRSLKSSRLVLIKVGSAVLAGKEGVNLEVLNDLAAQIAELRSQGRQVVLVSSGAVAAGRAALGPDCDTGGMSGRQGAAAVGQSRLMQSYNQAFAAHGLLAAQILLTRDDLRSRQRFLNARNTFAALLGWGVVPIVNENDTVSTQELRFGDNDCLAGLLVNLVEADVMINLTSAAGVFAVDPAINPRAHVMPCIESIGDLDLEPMCGSKTTVGTGGMRSKLTSARRVAQLGVPTLILPGKTSGIISQVFKDRGPLLGTWVRPKATPISRRKFWLAYQSEPAGEVVVDAGAAAALLEHGGSLLPGGITEINGTFNKGALLRISAAGKNIGVGLSNYGSPELKRIIGLKRHEVAAILGDAHYPEVIHRDNLLLDAAI